MERVKQTRSAAYPMWTWLLSMPSHHKQCGKFQWYETWFTLWTTGHVWVHTQHCGYWYPDVIAPSHQYPQCWLNIHYIGPFLYRNITVITYMEHIWNLNIKFYQFINKSTSEDIVLHIYSLTFHVLIKDSLNKLHLNGPPLLQKSINIKAFIHIRL